MTRTVNYIFLLIISSLAISCSATGSGNTQVSDIFKGTRPLPEGYRKVFINSIEGESIDHAIRETVYSSLKESINKNDQLTVVELSEESDIILNVKITWFSSEPVKYNSLGVVEERRLRMVSVISLVFTKTGETRWRDKSVESELIFSDVKIPVMSEYRALELLSDKLSERIISVILTGWYREDKKVY